MNTPSEVELKFLVPPAARDALTAELARGSANVERTTLAAMYLDTEDRRLARAGIAWRLRREGRRWIQTLKAATPNALERFEHEVIRPGATHDAAQHAGTAVGDRLIRILRAAASDGVQVGVRFQTEVRRSSRRIRTRGAVVDVALDEGRMLSDDASQRIRELEFELVSGSALSLITLAERWRKRFGLILDPRSKAERGDQLAAGSEFPPVRKARRPEYPADASAVTAFGTVLDECLAQITRNAIGVSEGDPASRVEHVHQLRVGIRRLRSALRSFEGWVPAPPDELIQDLRALFATLGLSRDSDVLDMGVVAELAKVGAPPLALPAVAAGPDPAETVRAHETQQSFVAWIAWRAGLAEQPIQAAVPPTIESVNGESTATPQGDGQRAQVTTDARSSNSAGTFHRNVERRLRRWHRRIVADWKMFDDLDEPRLHALRKRIKRQRYAVEFFAPVLRRRTLDRYLKPLAVIQDRMGELNDLFVARTRHQDLVASDPAAWFALGWITARVAEVRALAKHALGALAQVDSPTR